MCCGLALQAGDVRNGKTGPNTQVTMFVYDLYNRTQTVLQRPNSYADVYVLNVIICEVLHKITSR